MSRRKLLLICLLLILVRIAIFAIPALAGDELPPEPRDEGIIGAILAALA